MAKNISLGSISHGTLKSSDLVQAFHSELSHNERTDFDATGSGKIVAGLMELNDDDVWDAFNDTDDAPEIVEELSGILGSDLPPFFRFGAHEGDGSDFGYWFDNDAFEQSVRDGETVKVSEINWSAWNSAEHDEAYVAVISDHGNIELYTAEGKHLYGVV